MLIIGTLSNSKSRKSCGISHHRLLSIGGILCFIHGLFTVAYYVSATATAREDRSNRSRAAATTTTAA
ncbi:Histone H2A 10 [Hibiscus syriacus]|uniref:Histone H2A 10 n=2 Tax=Hibiscus syriacus TaxID=106335 RepID=A0A6A2XUB4_HIBSY|nr:Histone H2A 10 [Hibiscus syriacus]